MVEIIMVGEVAASMGEIPLPVRWARSQLEPWRSRAPYDPEELAQRLEHAAATSPTVFLFDFSYNYVSVRPKQEDVFAHAGDARPELIRRKKLYQTLFQDIIDCRGLRCRFTLALDVDDHPVQRHETPIFSFQKHHDSSLILLPDVDLLTYKFFIGQEYQHDEPYASKLNQAIFAGATTGANITPEVVDALAAPRLRSAVFFRDRPEVNFTLPKIVQCSGPEAEEKVRALNVGGPELTWSEQLKSKYLISMDGNGATCSRVAAGLLSNSALLKYQSPFDLYYFKGLSPGVEYVDIHSDEEVLAFIAEATNHPEIGEQVAERGRRFAKRYLSRPAIHLYVAELLDGYGRMLESPGVCADANAFAVDVLGHVACTGDTWSGADGWLGDPSRDLPIEGFSLHPWLATAEAGVSYQALLADGSLSQPCADGMFCGTRGRGLPLRGFQASLTIGDGDAPQLVCQAVFRDGHDTGPTPLGVLCRSPNNAELLAMRVSILKGANGR